MLLKVTIPIYGIVAPDHQAESDPNLSIEKLAYQYLKAIAKVQPNGPYMIGGASFGGIVAFEICQQTLETRNRKLDYSF